MKNETNNSMNSERPILQSSPFKVVQYRPDVSIQLSMLYGGADTSRGHCIGTLFNNSYRAFIAHDTNGEIVGAVRAFHDGVYTMIWDLCTDRNRPDVKESLLSTMVQDLTSRRHDYIAAIIPKEDVSGYHAHGLVYGTHITVTTLDRERAPSCVNAGREVKHPLWRSGARTLGNLCLFRGIGPRMDTGANKECIETWNNGTGFGNGCFGTG